MISLTRAILFAWSTHSLLLSIWLNWVSMGLSRRSPDDLPNTFRHSRAEQAKLAGQNAATAGPPVIEGLQDETSDDEAQRTRPFFNETWQALFSARLRQRERTVLSSGHTDGMLKAAR